MPRSLLPLGILALAALLAWLLLGGGDERAEEQADPDAPLAYETKAGDSPQKRSMRPGGPTLEADAAAQARAEELERERAASAATAGPTGPYALDVVRAETEMPLEDVALFEDGAEEPFGKTDANGEWSAEDMGAPSLAYRAVKDGYLEHHGVLHPGERPEVVLHAGVPVSGHVLQSGSRTPIADAQVRVWDVDLAAEIATTHSDEEGRFRLRAIRPHHPLYVVATAEGLVPHFETVTFEGAEEDYEVFVGRDGRIEGHVLDEQGRPRPATEVRLVGAGRTLFEQRPDQVASPTASPRRGLVVIEQARTAVTHTDAQGRYSFTGVPFGARLQCVAVITPRLLARSKQLRLDAKHSEAQVDLAVPQAGSVLIRVEEGAGLTLGHAHLRITLDGAVLAPMADDHWADGAFLIQGLGPGRVHVRAEIPGRPVAQATDVLRAGGTLQLSLRMPAGREVLGEVRDKRGQPIWKALVSWYGGGPREKAQVRTDLRGRFSLSGLEAEEGTLGVSAFDLPHTRQAYESETLEFIRPGEGRQFVTLKDGTTITGRFTDLPEHADVTIERVGGVPQEAGRLPLDEEGRFRWRGPPANRKGPHAWVFRTHGLPPLVVEERGPFRSEEVRDLGRLAFEDANPRRGQVVDEHGHPVHAAKVVLAEAWSHRSTRTDTKGEFGFARVPDEDLKLRIIAPDHPPQATILGTRSQYVPQVIRLRAGRWVTILVVDERGKPARGARLQLREGGRGANSSVHGIVARRWVPVPASGQFRTYLPFGTYQVVAIERGAVGVAPLVVKYKGDGKATVKMRRRR